MIEAITKRVAGLDIHKMMIMASILIEEEDGTITEETREFGTFSKDLKQLAHWLTELQIELVVMESTGVYWKSPFAALGEADIRCLVVNAQHVKQLPGRKTDVKDSQWLASLARCGLLRGSFIPPKELRELRLVGRRYTKLAKLYASEKNRLHKTLDDSGIRLGGVVSDINGMTARKIIDALISGADIQKAISQARGNLKKKIKELGWSMDVVVSQTHRFVLLDITSHLRFLEASMRSQRDYLFSMMECHLEKEWNILQTIPGIDAMSAAIILVELGVDMEQFGSPARCASWAGVCPGNNESAAKKKSGRTRKGSRQIRTILCEVANAAVKTRCQFKGKYRAMTIRRGHKRTIFAIAHKILRTIYAMLEKGTAYKDPDIDFEGLMVKRNAPRWIKVLKKMGYLQAA